MTQEGAAEVEERYRALVEAAPDGIVVHHEGVVLYANPAAARIFAAPSPQDLVGRQVMDLVHPDHRDTVRERIRAIEQQGARTEPAEILCLRLDGSTVPVEAAGHPVRYAGRVADQSILRDVTARKQAEAAAAAQNLARPLVRQIIQTLLQHVPVPRQATADLGRRLAAAEFDDARAALEAYRAMGLGTLRLERATPPRYEFTGDDLIERSRGAAQPTCHLSLSFLEGAVSAIHRAPALGTELLCQSQGHDRCRFVVMLKGSGARAPEPPRAKGGLGSWL